ncbi:MAG: phage major capsid protein [Clostridiales bacterium]|nr:phage major capsid protein [Clostridiales bacterium]
MKKSMEMKQKLETLKNEVKQFLVVNKADDAEEKMKELRNYKKQIALQEELEADEEEELQTKAAKGKAEKDNLTKKAETTNAANTIRAIIKKMTNRNLTEAENALLLPTTENTSGENGEGYIIPQDIRTTIIKKMREWKSARTVVGEMQVSGLTGSIPIENFETLTELVDFADGTDGKEQTEVKFKNITFSLKEKAAFMKLSNTLLNLSDENLVAYISEIFAKKAVLTENKMIFATLKSNKTVKTIADWKALKSSINKDLDPSSLYNTIIVTNQDGWDMLDSAVDGQGRPILQPDPTNPTRRFLGGYPVEVFSNTLFQTTEDKIPFIYGNLKDAVKVCDLNRMAFATSSEAGFMSNTTIARVIEFIDVIQCDESDKCYVYAEMPTGE